MTITKSEMKADRFGEFELRIRRKPAGKRGCWWCDGTIDPGDRYLHVFGIADGEIAYSDIHEECFEAGSRSEWFGECSEWHERGGECEH